MPGTRARTDGIYGKASFREAGNCVAGQSGQPDTSGGGVPGRKGARHMFLCGLAKGGIMGVSGTCDVRAVTYGSPPGEPPPVSPLVV